MAIGVTTTLFTSLENFDALHAAMLRYPMPPDVGLISHVARATDDGVEIVEVWDSKEAFERFTQDIAPVVLREVLGDGHPVPEMRADVWELRSLAVPGAGLAI
jgi:hypothetical protein